MLENGADIRYIQQLLGHEKLDTTAIYTEVRSNSCRKSMPAAIPPPGSETPVPPPVRRLQNRPKIVLPRPRPNDTVGAWKREQPVPSFF